MSHGKGARGTTYTGSFIFHSPWALPTVCSCAPFLRATLRNGSSGQRGAGRRKGAGARAVAWGLLPHVAVRRVALLPRGAQNDFAHQAVAVAHAQRLLEQAAHLLPVRGGRAGGSGKRELGVAAVEHNVEP